MASINADMQHEACMIRRNLIIGQMQGVSETIKNACKSVEISEWLFGDTVLEKNKNINSK